MPVTISARALSKTFTLHTQGGTKITVFENVSLEINSGECVCFHGPSGAGKSTLLRALYANYKVDAGEIVIKRDGLSVDLARAEPWEVIELRRYMIGYVSQFLRVIPRVSALEIVAEPGVSIGMSADEAQRKASSLLERLRVPERLWSLAPATFSGGEQQRVNIARGFIVDYPVLLLDEPTASLDVANRDTVVSLIAEAKARGAAIAGIFHDEEVRDAVTDRRFVVGGGREVDNQPQACLPRQTAAIS